MFVDWLSLTQDHGSAAPELVGGLGVRGDGERLARCDFGDGADGDTAAICMVGRPGQGWIETAYDYQHPGSYDTSVSVRSYRGRVTWRGNPSRWGRPDNLFGYSLGRCVEIVNSHMRELGLPEFTPGVPCDLTRTVDGQREDYPGLAWTGARVSTIDLTRNYSAGSDWLARQAITCWQGLAPKRMRPEHYRDETAMWVTKRRSVKAYRKAHDMRTKTPDSPWTAWAESQGVVRVELRARSDALADAGLSYLGSCLEPGALEALYARHTAHLEAPTMPATDLDLETLRPEHRATYVAWQSGHDVRRLLSRATYYRHRKALAVHGVNLDAPLRSTVVEFPRRVIRLEPLEAPAGYWLHELREAA